MLHPDQLAELERTLPAVISRAEVPKLTGGLISAGRLANLDCLGQGPRRLMAGGLRRVSYTRGDFLAWLSQRSAASQPDPDPGQPVKRGPGRPRKVPAQGV